MLNRLRHYTNSKMVSITIEAKAKDQGMTPYLVLKPGRLQACTGRQNAAAYISST